MADLTNSPVPPTDPFNADVYWRYASEGDENLRLLGTFGIGVPQSALLPIPAAADVVLKALPRGPRGTYQHALAAEGPSTTINVPGIGGGGSGSSYYQTLRQNDGYSSPYWPSAGGAALPQEGAINFLQSFRLVDDPAHGETDLYTYGVPTGMLNLKTDFNASGQINVTTGNILTGALSTLVCTATLDLQPGQGIYIAGAGSPGALITKVTAVSTDGKTYTLQDPAAAPVSGATVQADDTAAVQAWVDAKGDLSMPPGYYRLTSSIVLPTTSEGFSIIIHGSGWDVTTFAFQHGGDGFIPTSDLRIDSVCFLDLVIATGTIGDTSGTIDANSKGIGLRMAAPDYTGVYDQFVMNRCRIIGWGRFGIWSDNLEVSWIGECIFRENKSGHVAFVGPDTISPNKQPNANTLTNCTFDQAIGVNDAKRTVTGSMTSGSQILTVSGTSLTANDRGRFVIVHGAATIGGDLYSFIDSVQSGTSCTLAHQAKATSSGTLEIFPTNVASILLNRANDTVIDGATIQGNFVGCSTSADINAVKIYNSANCRIVGVHEEDNAGWGGAAVRMENCTSIGIDNWGGTSGDSALQNAHNSDFSLINSHCVSVENSYFNDRPQFVIDSTSSETRIDDSFVVGFINLWQQDQSWDKLRIGSGVRVYQSTDPRTNQSCGNEYIYDSLFGRDLITNGRFLDGNTAGAIGLDGWTTTNPTWWSRTATSQTRYGTYINTDSTAIADGGPQTLLHQAVAIPDSLPPGAFTLAFDWQIFNESGSSTATGRFTEIRLHPSVGLDEAMQWSVRGFSYVIGVWQTAQIKCWLGSGTSRTIDVQINATSGVNNVRMRFANFRLTPGKHSFGSYERAINDFGGRMHMPFEIAPLPTPNPPPPPTGSDYISLVNIGGVLNQGKNNAYTPIATGGGSIGPGTGGRVSRFAGTFGTSGSSTISDSGIADDGTAVTIGFGRNSLSILRPDVYAGPVFSVYDQAGSVQQFTVNQVGDLRVIRGLGYNWPSTQGTTGQFLGVASVTGGVATLAWQTGGGTIGPGTSGTIAMFNSAAFGTTGVTTIKNSGLSDDGATIRAFCNQFSVEQKNAANDLVDLFWKGAAALGNNYGIIRYEHRSGLLFDSANTAGEFQFFLNSSSNTVAIGAKTITSKGNLIQVWPPSTYAGPVLVVFDSTGTTQQFSVNQIGEIRVINQLGYHWPGPGQQGAAGQVLGIASVTGGVATLAWQGTGFTVQDEGAALTPRNTINFKGAAIQAVDDAPNFRTNVTVSAVTGGGTLNYLTKWSTSTTPGQLVNSVAYDDGGSNFQLQTQQFAVLRPDSYSGPVISVYNQAGTIQQFTVNNIGELRVINQLGYHWPGPGAQGTAGQVLGIASVLSGVATLAWQTVTGGAGANTALSNLTATSINQSFVFNADGVYNIGDPTNRVGAIYLKNAFFVYTVGSTSSSPKAAGFLDPGSGECTRLLLSGNQSVAQGGFNQRTQITAYHAIELRGCRVTTTPPPFFNVVSPPDSAGVAVFQDNDVIPFWIVGTNTGRTTDLCRMWNNGQNEMSVSAAGTLVHNGGIVGGFPPAAVPASGGTVLFSNYLDAHTVQIDTVNGNSTLQLPALSTVRHGQRWRVMLRRRTGTNQVSVVVAGGSGNLINDAFSAITMIAGTSGQREYLVIADTVTGNWWFAAMSV